MIRSGLPILQQHLNNQLNRKFFYSCLRLNLMVLNCTYVHVWLNIHRDSILVRLTGSVQEGRCFFFALGGGCGGGGGNTWSVLCALQILGEPDIRMPPTQKGKRNPAIILCSFPSLPKLRPLPQTYMPCPLPNRKMTYAPPSPPKNMAKVTRCISALQTRTEEFFTLVFSANQIAAFLILRLCGPFLSPSGSVFPYNNTFSY